MAALNEAVASPRKRIATYGKAVRKRLPEYLESGEEQKTVRQSIKEEAAVSNSSSRNTLRLPSAARSRHVSPVISSQSSVADVFAVPSDSEVTLTPVKKKKKKTLQGVEDIISKKRTHADQTVRETSLKRIKTRMIDEQRSGNPGSSNKATISPHSQAQDTQVQLRFSRNGSPADILQTFPTDFKGGLQRVSSPIIQRAPGQRASISETTISFQQGHGRVSASATQRKLHVANTLQHPSTAAHPLEHNGDRTSTSNPTKSPMIVPKESKLWDGLLNDEQDERVPPTMLPYNIGGKQTSLQTPPRQQNAPRQRLIDRLVKNSNLTRQTPDTFSDYAEERVAFDTKSWTSQEIASHQEGTLDTSRTTTFTENKKGKFALIPAVAGGPSVQTLGPRVTYSRQRSMLAEEDVMTSVSFDSAVHQGLSENRRTNRRGSAPTIVRLHSLQETSEVQEGHSSKAILTVHELRQSGANRRFTDEMEDLLDRIGSPSKQVSTRRSGLLDLTEKMRDTEFYTSFITHGMDQRLFVHLGQEADIIIGFLMVSLLMVVIDAGITPLVVTQLRQHGITRLLIKQIEVRDAITTIAGNRKMNMSKAAQTMLLDEQKHLLGLPMWEEVQPRILSPRTAALRCLELIVRQTREAGNSDDILSKELMNKLFEILRACIEDFSWEQLQGVEAVDFQLALSTLESHSLRVMTNSDSSDWVDEYLPTIRVILERALANSTDEPLPLQILLLRLVLNVTNNNRSASDVFATPELIGGMSRVIIGKFDTLSRSLVEDTRLAVVDHLVLMLGVMINFAEWSPLTRQCFQLLQQKGEDLLGELVQIFLDNQENILEADSVEDSHRNVVFGYLSVLLGFTCLSPDLADRVRMQQSDRTLQPLIACIEEFISHHKKVDDLFENDADGHNPQSGLTERLQRMVESLRAAWAGRLGPERPQH